MSETIVVPDNSGNNMNNAWPWLAMNNGGWGNGIFGGGFGAGFLGGILGGLFPNFFGGWGNGWGNNGNNGAAAASLGAQATAYNNTDLLMQAITSQGEQSRQATQTLSTMLGQDFNLVNQDVQAVQTALATIAANQGMNVMQVVNAIQSGNAALASQLCQCCCENRLLTTEQGYEAQIRTLEQTNQLGSQADRNANDIIKAINAQTVEMDNQFCAARERDMQAKIDTQSDIITQLRSQIDNANQTNQIIGYVNSVIAPLQKTVTEIADKQVNTIPVPWPNLTAVNTTPYMGGFYGNGFFGNGWNNGINF